MKVKLLLISIALNIFTISWLVVIFKPFSENKPEILPTSDDFYDELCPTVIYNKDDSVQVGFTDNGVTKRGPKKFDNCISTNPSTNKLHLHYMKKCLPLFKKYKPRTKKKNRELMKSIPSYVPSFNESNTVVEYPYDQFTWKQLYKTPISKMNLLNKLRFYSRRKGKNLIIFEIIFCPPNFQIIILSFF
jgi:hypothetical protein